LVLDFFASELRLRGNQPIVQPHESPEHRDVLCWNGEVFRGLDMSVEDNDGLKMFDALHRCRTPDEIVNLLGSIEGPYAFVYYSSQHQTLYFSRDPLGRRSLLMHKPTPDLPRLMLASVSCGLDRYCEFEEISSHTIFRLDLKMLASSSDVRLFFLISLDAKSKCILHDMERHLVFSWFLQSSLPSVNKAIPVGTNFGHIPTELDHTVNEFSMQLVDSVRRRVVDVPSLGGEARVAVLFSGGVDSAVIAFLADRHLPKDEPIDLLNVAFENPRKLKERKGKDATQDFETTVIYMVPDRLTGLEELAELRRLCPHRKWNFVEINVPYSEALAAQSTIEKLMYPNRTVMDMSLAQALYFASKGSGCVRDIDSLETKPYTSPSRVLLNGLGADELLGGYGRHRTVFQHRGWEGIIAELQLELDRIPARNLGRDDRIVSSHGKEVRHPFLSLDLVSFLSKLPVYFKTDPRQEIGVGDKMLLRMAAHRMGMVEASRRKKRAMQFGSHSARMQVNSATKGDVLI
ncbi:hypothetical protein FISHEDRAFT_23907, partial [Fistulina hepatica ATCC 64428]